MEPYQYLNRNIRWPNCWLLLDSQGREENSQAAGCRGNQNIRFHYEFIHWGSYCWLNLRSSLLLHLSLLSSDNLRQAPRNIGADSFVIVIGALLNIKQKSFLEGIMNSFIEIKYFIYQLWMQCNPSPRPSTTSNTTSIAWWFELIVVRHLSKKYSELLGIAHLPPSLKACTRILIRCRLALWGRF